MGSHPCVVLMYLSWTVVSADQWSIAQLSTAPCRFYRVSRFVTWTRSFRMLCGFICFSYAIITSILMIYRDDLPHDFEV